MTQCPALGRRSSPDLEPTRSIGRVLQVRCGDRPTQAEHDSDLGTEINLLRTDTCLASVPRQVCAFISVQCNPLEPKPRPHLAVRRVSTTARTDGLATTLRSARDRSHRCGRDRRRPLLASRPCRKGRNSKQTNAEQSKMSHRVSETS